jgi:hypothetical protein
VCVIEGSLMDITCAGLRDRRVAASEERRHHRRRQPIKVIVLHQTSGHFFTQPAVTAAPSHHRAQQRRGAVVPYPVDPATDANVRSNHNIDAIKANFVVIDDGTIFYTHDIEYLSRSAGGQFGVDIEFAGRFSAARRLSPAAVQAGRHLVSALVQQVPTITHIHPHGQIQHRLMGRDGQEGVACGADTGVRCGKIDSCPGPDIWINVGEWAATHHHLITDTPLPSFQNNGISDAQRNQTFNQHIP